MVAAGTLALATPPCGSPRQWSDLLARERRQCSAPLCEVRRSRSQRARQRARKRSFFAGLRCARGAPGLHLPQQDEPPERPASGGAPGLCDTCETPVQALEELASHVDRLEANEDFRALEALGRQLGNLGHKDAKEKKPAVYEGFAAGKYSWDDAKRVDVEMGEAITEYAWADGVGKVSIYIELPGLDNVEDDELAVESGERSVSLTVAAVGGKRRRFALDGLFDHIVGVKLDRKKGKNTVVLKLQKKAARPWNRLRQSE